MSPARRGPTQTLTDVPGLLVGHHQRIERGWATGTTVILCPAGATSGVDVRGGGPGTRETDLLRPENLVQQVHAICLSGGSAYGLAAADGVMSWLARRGIGFPVGPGRREVVPIVPAAVIFDLGRGGRFASRPTAAFGNRAADVAGTGRVELGTVGAGAGALAGGIKGGVGSSSVVLADGTIVAALAVVNAAGSVIDPATALPYAAVEGVRLRRPPAEQRRLFNELRQARIVALNTTIGVVATSARLTKAECTKFAGVAHDGLARAVRPAHSLNDGDTIFALATGSEELVDSAADEQYRSPATRPAWLNSVFEAGAQCFAEACTLGVLRARGIDGHLSYAEICPNVLPV